jgi:NAD(P)-dependent dehydrogenase (short-subunit alcohol dehydrogenase family)
MSSSKRLADQVALVVGAATGIGAATSRRFRAEGAQVAAAGLQAAELASMAGEIGALAIECDVSDEAAVRALICETVAQCGKLTIVVNCAAVVSEDYAATIEDHAWRRMFEVNLDGTMRVCRAALPVMEQGGGGSIVNIASIAAFNSTPGWASYSASKAGVVSLTRSIANAYGSSGIRANCLCPGLMRTRLSEPAVQQYASTRGVSVDQAWQEIAAQASLRRLATPEEIAACALFLASDEASMVTGVALVADGGSTFRPSIRSL